MEAINTVRQRGNVMLKQHFSDSKYPYIEYEVCKYATQFIKGNAGLGPEEAVKIFQRHYARKIRSIAHNAKNNSSFVSFVERSIIPTEKIPHLLPDEMNHCGPHSIMKARLEEKERIIEQWREYWETEHQSSKGMYTCKCCKSSHTVFNAVQTRSADEPMTIFITCMACNNRWRE
jgi:transcription elongation factor S-II